MLILGHQWDWTDFNASTIIENQVYKSRILEAISYSAAWPFIYQYSVLSNLSKLKPLRYQDAEVMHF